MVLITVRESLFRVFNRNYSKHCNDRSPTVRQAVFLATIVALIMSGLASVPQLHPWVLGIQGWNDSFVSYYFDEPAYLVYVQGLIDGRPRRNDPYTGFSSKHPEGQSESLFSIQFLPAYILAVPARQLGASSSEAFILLRTVAAFMSALTIFWLVYVLTDSLKVSTLGTLVILCLGCYAGSAKSLHSLVALQSAGYDFPFLRCSVPALPFPLFFAFIAVVCKGLTSRDRIRSLVWAGLAGVCFIGLLFSYFFLWTAAVAWLSCLILVWVLGARQDGRRFSTVVGFVLAVVVCSMIPYFFLLQQRSPTMDEAQLLLRSHWPDFSHRSEFVGAGIIAVLVLAIRAGYLEAGHPLNRIIVSFALLPFAVFNQQVLTGFSLQPYHYELYIAPYSVTLAGVLLAAMLIRRQVSVPSLVLRRTSVLVVITVLVVARATATTVIMSSRNIGPETAMAEKFAVVKKMHEKTAGKLDQEQSGRPTVFFTDLDQADMAPAMAPYLVLWAPHMFVFPTVSAGENKERLFRYLYFTGVTPQQFAAMASMNSYVSLALFGFERASRQDVNVDTIQPEDVRQLVEEYSQFISSFAYQDASVPRIDYVVTYSKGGPDLSNFDRWYERYDSYSIGDFTIWRTKPRR